MDSGGGISLVGSESEMLPRLGPLRFRPPEATAGPTGVLPVTAAGPNGVLPAARGTASTVELVVLAEGAVGNRSRTRFFRDLGARSPRISS